MITTKDEWNKALIERYGKDVQKKFKNSEILLTGHSAGGMMAQYVAAKENRSAITFASAGIGKYLKKLEIKDADYPKIVNYTAQTDFITNPFFENIGVEYKLPLESHAIKGYMSSSIYNERIQKDPVHDSKISANEVVFELAKQANEKIDDITQKLVDPTTYKKLYRKFFK